MSEETIWELFDSPSCPAPDTMHLMRWSLSFDMGERPFELFCDIVGFSEEAHGMRLYKGNMDNIQHCEADYLGRALIEWGSHPQTVSDWLWRAFYASE